MQHLIHHLRPAVWLLAAVLFTSACSTRAPILLVGQTGLAVANGIGELQVAVKKLTEQGTLTPAVALPIQERLRQANAQFRPLPSLLHAIDITQEAGGSTAHLVERALALMAAVLQELDVVIAAVPLAESVQQLLALAATARTTVLTLIATLERLRVVKA